MEDFFYEFGTLMYAPDNSNYENSCTVTVTINHPSVAVVVFVSPQKYTGMMVPGLQPDPVHTLEHKPGNPEQHVSCKLQGNEGVFFFTFLKPGPLTKVQTAPTHSQEYYVDFGPGAGKKSEIPGGEVIRINFTRYGGAGINPSKFKYDRNPLTFVPDHFLFPITGLPDRDKFGNSINSWTIRSTTSATGKLLAEKGATVFLMMNYVKVPVMNAKWSGGTVENPSYGGPSVSVPLHDPGTSEPYKLFCVVKGSKTKDASGRVIPDDWVFEVGDPERESRIRVKATGNR